MNVNSVFNLTSQLHIYISISEVDFDVLCGCFQSSVRKYSDRRKYNYQWKSPIWRTDFEILPVKIDEKKLFWGCVRKEYMSCTQIIKFLFFVYLFVLRKKRKKKQVCCKTEKSVFKWNEWMSDIEMCHFKIKSLVLLLNVNVCETAKIS